MAETHERRTAKGAWVRSQVYTYEERLDNYPEWAFHEMDTFFFSGDSEVKKTLRRLAKQLDELQLPYATIGAMAMNAHGYRRVTTDVDVVVTRESLRKLHDALDGRGYLPPFEGSKNLRDTENGVRIDLVVAGDFPGDGREKPIDFPDPATGCVVIEGIRYVTLAKLVELKLASGMTQPTRLKDLGDVQSMIHRMKLPRSFGAELHPYVRGKFDEFWLANEADTRKDEF